MIVDTDDVLGLFGASDEDIYAKGTIEDAIYDGTLKPAETERKTGRWTKIHWKAFRCSECNRLSEFCTDFCPNCGSLMEK